MHYTCPRCGSQTSHPDDYMQGYCSRCHDWTGGRPWETAPLPWSRPDADVLGDIRAAMADQLESMSDYIRRSVPLAAPEVVLTPGLLMTDTRWSLDRETPEFLVFSFHPLRGPWVSSWRPDDSLGACTVSWERDASMQLQLDREVVERAAVTLAGEMPLHRIRRHPALCRVLEGMHGRILDAVQQNYHPYASQHASRLYRCGQCGTEFTVPPDHPETVLCGAHHPAVRMEPAPEPGLGPWEAGSNGEAANTAEDVLEFYRRATAAPASLAEALEAVRELRDAEIARNDRHLLAGAIAQWEDAQDRAREHIGETMADLAGRQVEIQASVPADAMAYLENQLRAACGLPPAQGVLDANPDLVLDTQVAAQAREQMPPRPRAGSHTGDSSAARRGRQPSRHEDPAARRARVLEGAEEMIARLDGEGYGVVAKADQVDRETPSVPELPMFDHDQGGNASRWRPGDPIL